MSGGRFIAKHSVNGHVIVAHWHGGFYVNLQVVYGLLNPLGPVISSVRQTMLLGHNPSWAPLVAAGVGASSTSCSAIGSSSDSR